MEWIIFIETIVIIYLTSIIVSQTSVKEALQERNSYLNDLIRYVPLEMLTPATAKKNIRIRDAISSIYFINTSPDEYFIREHSCNFDIMAIIYPRNERLILEDMSDEFKLIQKDVHTIEFTFSVLFVMGKDVNYNPPNNHVISDYCKFTNCLGKISDISDVLSKYHSIEKINLNLTS